MCKIYTNVLNAKIADSYSHSGESGHKIQEISSTNGRLRPYLRFFKIFHHDG
jgi:hypothetical protein